MVINKVFGIDKISVKVIKDCFFVILVFFIFIINVLFIINIFLDAWKLVEVILVLKSGDYEVSSNNRFIFFLLVLLKVCE